MNCRSHDRDRYGGEINISFLFHKLLFYNENLIYIIHNPTPIDALTTCYTDFVRYVLYRNVQFQKDAIIVKTNVPLPPA